ncbi:MAG: transglutaminase domain-containing protein [Lachnospiraceae bacterium]|nr:transglutaminase domain-containing protein [Lachnospiraceae bacterium]
MNGTAKRRRLLLLLAGVSCVLIFGIIGFPAYRHRQGVPEGTKLVFANEDEIVERIRSSLKKKSSVITIEFPTNGNYVSDMEEIVAGWMDRARENTGIPDEGDYLRYQMGGYTVSYGNEDSWRAYRNSINITPVYFTTPGQEQEVDELVEAALEEINASQYESQEDKVRAVYEYIYENVSYDTVHEKNDDYFLDSTAYAALHYGNASCQGYSVLAYRLLMELSVENRIQTGYASKDGIEEYHSWNVVMIDGEEYHLDITFNKALETEKYYMVTAEELEDHRY